MKLRMTWKFNKNVEILYGKLKYHKDKGGIEMFCHVCGSELKEGAKFCSVCGCPVGPAKVEPAPAPVQRTVQRTMQGTKKKDIVFQASAKTPIIYFISAVALVFSALLCFYQRAELYGGNLNPNRNAGKRWDLFLWGVVSLALAAECLLAWWGSTKIKLIVGELSVSGVRMVNILQTKEFEYDYDEIFAVKNSILGTLVLKVDGKNILLANLENRKRAMKLIEERIRK